MDLPGQEAKDAELTSAFEQVKEQHEELHADAQKKMSIWCVFKQTISGGRWK